jgi:hypothetical protein
MSTVSSVHVRDFQEIAQDHNNKDVEVYGLLDQSDLIKLIAGTSLSLQLESDFIKLGWREQTRGGHGSEEFKWTKSWIETLISTQLLVPFYVYLKRITNS